MRRPSGDDGVDIGVQPAGPSTRGRVATLLRFRADRSPDAVATVDLGNRKLTYGDLHAASLALADELERPPGPPGLVLVSLPNCIEAMVAAFAVFGTRHALVVVHPQLPDAARAEAFELLRPVGQIVQDGGELRVVRDPYGPATALWQAPSGCPELSIAMCILTSGSTGRPRLIAAPHRQVLSAVSLIGRRLRYRSGDLVAVTPPLSFDYGLYQLLLSTEAGAAALLDTRLGTVQGLAHALVHTQVNVLPLVPTMLRATASAPMIGRLNTSRVRLITTTGDLLTEADSVAAHAAFPEAQVVPMYGLSECKRVAITPTERHADRPAGAVGMPLNDTDVTIAGPTVHRLKSGITGELVVAGPHLTLGYLEDPEANARRFAIDRRSGVRILRTGDRLRQDEAGWLYWAGRSSDVIKVSGFRLDPAELEVAAARNAAVIESAAYGRPDALRGQVPVLVVRLRIGIDHERGRRELARALGELLPRWAMPEIEIRDEPLPRTRNGKIDRARLGNGQSSGAGGEETAGDEGHAQPLIDLAGIPTSRHFINCHTQAFMSAYEFPFAMSPAEFEVVTTTPFGVRCIPNDPHRLLVPYLDPDIGLDRACALLGLRVETRWYSASAAQDALVMLEDWLRTGPVVLGPIDLGYLNYHGAAQSLKGCDHYIVVLGHGDDDEFIVRDPEGFFLTGLDQETLTRAWAASAVPEGRGAFTQRRLILDPADYVSSPPDLLKRIAEHALDNLSMADKQETGGANAYRSLVSLSLDATRRRALSFLLPAASYRYRLASFVADRMESLSGKPGWHRLRTLFDAQLATLSNAHQELLGGGPIGALDDAVAHEEQIARCAKELRMLMPT